MAENHSPSTSLYIRFVAYCAFACCLLAVVDGLFPQLQMSLTGGRLLIGDVLAKILLVGCVLVGCFLTPRISLGQFPAWTWLLMLLFLLFEVGFLSLAYNWSLIDIFGSFNAAYLLPLVALPLLIFEASVPESFAIRSTILLFLLCATIGLAQHFTASPVLYVDSTNGSFHVFSWDFMGKLRAFSLFTSPLEYGIFCAFCGALGIAVTRTRPLGGVLLWAASAICCYTTLTRLSYIVFVCACSYALILTFGRKVWRGLWQPALFLLLGIAATIAGADSLLQGDSNALQNSGSLLERIAEWTYAYSLFDRASLAHKLFGLGITQNDKFSNNPIVIDSTPLALVLNIGVIGLILFTVYCLLAWLYLRRAALASHRPLIIAAASLWSTVLCAGLFNIVFSSFGGVLALAILCIDKDSG